MTTSDWLYLISSLLTIAAIFTSPVVALRIQNKLDSKKDQRERDRIAEENRCDRQLYVFKSLMATRASGLSGVHVEALNRIDLEFCEENDGEIIEAWRVYLDHLNTGSQKNVDRWFEKKGELLVDLLQKMAKKLDYNFDKTQIKNSTYYPSAYGDYELFGDELRAFVRQIIRKGVPIPVEIKNTDSGRAEPDGDQASEPETKTEAELEGVENGSSDA